MSWLLEMKNMTKTFGAVKAIDNVSLRLNAGEVVSLCGENGSGKSTLMKVLCGIYPHGSYEGEIIFSGETLQPGHIRDTERKGIAIIHQELALVKHLTVLENIFLGAEISRHGLLDYETMTLRCEKLLAQVNLAISPDTRVGDLGLGQQQLVEIAKALNKQVRLLILDEPTASLTEQETAILLNIIRDLQNHGIACIYISHKLNEVKAISNTICVIRDGQHIGTRNADGMNEDDIITMMVGRELTALYPNEAHSCGDEILRVENLTAWHPVNRHIKRVNDVSFSLRRGEILGIAGLVGAGRTEAVQCLFGVWPGRWQGKIFIDGQQVTIHNCQQAIAQGIAMVPEDRKKDGIVPVMAVGKNITLVGGNGDGQTCKVANQIIVALNIEAVSEALVFASKAGADPARVRQALMGGFASSRILEVHGERMLNRTFNPGFKISLHLALQSAKALALNLPNTATCQELFNTCAANGGSELDHSSLVQALELMANHKIS